MNDKIKALPDGERVRVETGADLPGEGRYLLTLETVAQGRRLAIFNVKEKPWLGVKIIAWMPLPAPYQDPEKTK